MMSLMNLLLLEQFGMMTLLSAPVVSVASGLLLCTYLYQHRLAILDIALKMTFVLTYLTELSKN